MSAYRGSALVTESAACIEWLSALPALAIGTEDGLVDLGRRWLHLRDRGCDLGCRGLAFCHWLGDQSPCIQGNFNKHNAQFRQGVEEDDAGKSEQKKKNRQFDSAQETTTRAPGKWQPFAKHAQLREWTEICEPNKEASAHADKGIRNEQHLAVESEKHGKDGE